VRFFIPLYEVSTSKIKTITTIHELESQSSQKWNEYSDKAKEQINKPFDYYRKQEAFYRGLFWICVGLLIILWILSGS